jgi:hypothetical protein
MPGTVAPLQCRRSASQTLSGRWGRRGSEGTRPVGERGTGGGAAGVWGGACGCVFKRSTADDLVRAVRALAHAVVGDSAADDLSEGEVQAIRLVARGYANKEIATKLALEKLGLDGRVDVVRLAVRQWWLTDDKPTG